MLTNLLLLLTLTIVVDVGTIVVAHWMTHDSIHPSLALNALAYHLGYLFLRDACH